MSDKCISSLHVQKLGHEIQEIRERALLNINSKLEHGFTFDNDLARSKEILTKLFEWFLFEPCTKQELVFSLIKRILSSEAGKTLVAHNGAPMFKNELQRLRTYIEPKYYPRLEETLEILNQPVVVPPLETDVPLSYRTGQSEFSARPVGTTATTIEGYIEGEASANQKNTVLHSCLVRLSVITTSIAGLFEAVITGFDCMQEHINFIFKGPESIQSSITPRDYIIYPLKWQFLIEADRQVLQSIEDSLKNPPQPVSLLHSADFFSNILLHDFPAEVFIQRPGIVTAFHDLVDNCPSTRVVNSVFDCLTSLTKALEVQINYYNDPCLQHTANEDESCSDEESARPENVTYLKTQQISFPQYCFSTYKCVFKYLCAKPDRKRTQKGVNLALDLLDELLNLLSLVLGPGVFLDDSSSLRKNMNDILISYGVTLEFFRVEACSDDWNVTNRVTQLCFLHNCANFLTKMVPVAHTGLILPRNLKTALANSLVDVTLSKLYPNLYNTLLNFVQSFKVGTASDALVKYHETSKICDSMTSAVDFMKHCKSLNACEGVNLAEKALASLEFHRDLTFVKQVVELCANKLPLYPYDEELLERFEFVILRLLSHNLDVVKEETYELCQKRVIAAIGPKLNAACSGAPGGQILFLCRSKVLVEIACHGMTSESLQIRNHSEDILIHIIKCKILVSEEIWNKIVQALIGSLPIVLCHCNKTTSLGRSLLDILDPDTAQLLFLSKIDVVRGNVLLLFTNESSVREEAFSRLCWLLAAQKDSREMLPRLNNLYDKALPNVCQTRRVTDANKNRAAQHFYQPSSLQQVLSLLKSPNVEPVIRRSALTQTSVMMEDPLLHTTFLSNDGLEIVLEVMKAALVEKNYGDYPDAVIPAISILKSVCLYQSSARQSLCQDVDVYCNVLRGLFLFFTEEKVKQDAVSLLFLLLFNDFVKGTPSKANFSVPYLLTKTLMVPFSCTTHWEISQYYEASLVELLTSDKSCLSSLQIQWNSEMFGGLEELLTWTHVDYKNHQITEMLKMRDYDLRCLKASNVDYYIRKYLIDVQNGTVHETVIDSINKLTTYVHLCALIPKQETFFEHPWESTFSRFLKILPSSEEDAKLLSTVLRFLKHLAPFYKSGSEPSFWLSQMLKNPTNCLLDLITVDQSSNEDFKTLSQDLLSLVTLCASQEQHFLDEKVSQIDTETWRNVIEIISKSLKFNDSTHFYNLSYLDSLLSCLVTLTASLGWSDTKPGSPPKNIHFQLVSSLCELVVVFHCGKGPTATVSVMGLSITRHVILTLNHLVSEVQGSKMKNWERCFMEVEEEEWLKSFLVLWSSRDVLLRAGALQLFSGLSLSPTLAINIVNELKNEKGGVWNLALSLLLDHQEASIVRENCAFLLGNLLGHYTNSKLVTSLVPDTMRKGKDESATIFDLLEDYQFFRNLVTICDSSTPSFITSVTHLLMSLLNLNEDKLTYKLQDFGIVKLLFRCVCAPGVTITDTKKLALYCDVLEMDIAICTLLSHAACVSFACLGTLLHTKDCLTVVVSLLNPRIYDTHLPQLVYLRNKLWSEIFKLLSVLTTCESKTNEALQILSDVIEDSGKDAFMETICEATKSLTFSDLQSSALLSLTSLLSSESPRDLMDTARTDTVPGTEICKILLNLYDLCNLKVSKDLVRKKSIITASLTSILCVSQEAKKYALSTGLPDVVIKQLKDFYVRLSLESVDCLRRVLEKKKVCPVLKELNELVGLVTNFMVEDELVKSKFAELGLGELVHKLWVWFALQNPHLVDTLRMLCTFTTGCSDACRSMAVAGRKVSLLHAVINLVEKEMELVSKTHSLDILQLCFGILTNCCAVLEGRILICKSNLFSSISRLHPAITKKQKPWDIVELIWLEFMQTFTLYPEGQSCIAKISDVFELVLALTARNRTTALIVLRNIAFYQPNRSRLLTSDEFLNLLKSKLENGNEEEKATVVLIMWSLAANNQKGKIVFKSAKLDAQLEQVLKHYQLSTELVTDNIDTMRYVLSVIRDGDTSL